jgi:hypothetical protein
MARELIDPVTTLVDLDETDSPPAYPQSSLSTSLGAPPRHSFPSLDFSGADVDGSRQRGFMLDGGGFAHTADMFEGAGCLGDTAALASLLQDDMRSPATAGVVSPFRGVTYSKGKWEASIFFGGRYARGDFITPT